MVHWLTAEHGRLATVAKGARQPKSPFAGKLDLAFECRLSFQRARRGDLHALREVCLVNARPRLRTDYAYLTQLAYVVALVEQLTESDTPLPEVHELFAGFLQHLPGQPPQPRTVYAFEVKLLSLLGLGPDPEESSLPAGARALLDRLLEAPWSDLVRLGAIASDVRSVRRFLNGCLTAQAGRPIPGRDAALDARGGP